MITGYQGCFYNTDGDSVNLQQDHFEGPGFAEAMGLAVLREAALPAAIPEERRERILRAGRAAAYHVADPKSDTAGTMVI